MCRLNKLLIIVFLIGIFGLVGCGEKENSKEKTNGEIQESTKDIIEIGLDYGETSWEFGELTDKNEDEIFNDTEGSINPNKIFNSLEITESMLNGRYIINNIEEDVKVLQEEVKFEELTYEDEYLDLSSLPVVLYFGKENFESEEYWDILEDEVAFVGFLKNTTDSKNLFGFWCTYKIDGRNITFKDFKIVDDKCVYTGVEFAFDFELCGPYITFIKDNYSLKLKAYGLTENNLSNLTIDFNAYSIPNSPVIFNLDYISCYKSTNYSHEYVGRRDFEYIDNSYFKFTDDGLVKIYLCDKDYGETGKEKEFIAEFAYIIQTRVSSGLENEVLIFFDGEKQYYYTDNIFDIQNRLLTEQDIDVNELDKEDIEEIANKTEDLYDDLQKEFNKQGINVEINRMTGEIAIDSSVLFGGDSSEITDSGKELLNKFLIAYASIIYNEKYDGFIEKTLIEGHTALLDGSTYESGLPLSIERADNVKNYCVSAQVGVDLSKLVENIESVGLSNSKPVYDSNGEIDLKASRRVSFRIVVDVDNLR